MCSAFNKTCSGMIRGMWQSTQGVGLASRLPGSQCSCASMGRPSTSPIHWGPTSQPTELNGSDISTLVPESKVLCLWTWFGLHGSDLFKDVLRSPGSLEARSAFLQAFSCVAGRWLLSCLITSRENIKKKHLIQWGPHSHGFHIMVLTGLEIQYEVLFVWDKTETFKKWSWDQTDPK